MSVGLDAFYAACPGVELTRDMQTAIAALPAGSSAAAIEAVVLPLIPQGNPFEYVNGPPGSTLMPGASPVLSAALPPQPTIAVPVDGGANPALGTVLTFAKGLPRFQDSNPDPLDGWSIERDEDGYPAGPW